MKKLLIAGLLLFSLLATISGCSGEISVTTAHISEATMARTVDEDYKPVDPTTVFTTDTAEIFCSAKIANAPAETAVRSVWIYVKGEAEGLTDYEIDSYELTAEGTEYMKFSLTRPDTGFPKGEYKLVLYIDAKEAESLDFTVE